MASIGKDKNGRRRILFVAPDGKRKTIRLGKMPQRAAEAIKVKVENLVGSAVSGCGWDNETARWVAELDDTLANRLAAVGLIQGRERATLDAFIESYFETRSDVKSATIINWGHTRRNLVEFFGANKPLRDVTRGDADEWRLSLIAGGLSDNTVRKRCSNAKQFFNAALRKRLIQFNPFSDLKSASTSNRKRDYFISIDKADKVLESCPDAEWRLIFALSRYGGLRCPSEHLALRWQDVDWDRNRVTVQSPKTEHHEGGESRVVPLFPELRPYLVEAKFDTAKPGTEYVITRYRDPKQNLRTQLIKIIKRAGLIPWPKLFQNLRATRETELAEVYPMHVVCAWIGNSQNVAAKHYLQVTDEHYVSAAQNPAQQAHAEGSLGSQEESPAQKKPPVLPGVASDCDYLRHRQVGDTGFEPVTSAV